MGDERDEVRETPLDTTVSLLLEEARMLLPGTQTLFGFQLAVVFTAQFRDLLSPFEQHLHLVGMLLTGVAVALLMAPAAYHRQAEPESVSRGFVRLATRQLVRATAPLALAIGVEVYLVASVVTRQTWASVGIAAGLLLVFVVLWYVAPARRRPPP